jgi:hypothetical protein
MRNRRVIADLSRPGSVTSHSHSHVSHCHITQHHCLSLYYSHPSPLLTVTRRVPRVVNVHTISLPALFLLCMQRTFMQPILAAKNAADHRSPMSSKYRCCRRTSASFQLPCGVASFLSRIQTSLAIQQLLLQRYKSVTNEHRR